MLKTTKLATSWTFADRNLAWKTTILVLVSTVTCPLQESLSPFRHLRGRAEAPAGHISIRGPPGRLPRGGNLFGSALLGDVLQQDSAHVDLSSSGSRSWFACQSAWHAPLCVFQVDTEGKGALTPSLPYTARAFVRMFSHMRWKSVAIVSSGEYSAWVTVICFSGSCWSNNNKEAFFNVVPYREGNVFFNCLRKLFRWP